MSPGGPVIESRDTGNKTETQAKLNNVWLQTEESVARAQAGVAPAVDQTSTQTTTTSGPDATVTSVPADSQQKIPQPVSTSSSDTAIEEQTQVKVI